MWELFLDAKKGTRIHWNGNLNIWLYSYVTFILGLLFKSGDNSGYSATQVSLTCTLCGQQPRQSLLFSRLDSVRWQALKVKWALGRCCAVHITSQKLGGDVDYNREYDNVGYMREFLLSHADYIRALVICVHRCWQIYNVMCDAHMPCCH